MFFVESKRVSSPLVGDERRETKRRKVGEGPTMQNGHVILAELFPLSLLTRRTLEILYFHSNFPNSLPSVPWRCLRASLNYRRRGLREKLVDGTVPLLPSSFLTDTRSKVVRRRHRGQTSSSTILTRHLADLITFLVGCIFFFPSILHP